MKYWIGLIALASLIVLTGCDEKNSGDTAQATPMKEPQPAGAKSDCREVALVDLAPGGVPPERGACPEAATYDGNPDQIAAGRQLYVAFNCVGCHFNGGGGMGPALMDDHWIYGSSMQNIASTIREGRPKGMPSFRAMVGDEQVWQLAAYVRSLSSLAELSKREGTEDK
jgi:cytochrome c oxidase cbb3-type subunit 3